jgi:hypothetical protein
MMIRDGVAGNTSRSDREAERSNRSPGANAAQRNIPLRGARSAREKTGDEAPHSKGFALRECHCALSGLDV